MKAKQVNNTVKEYYDRMYAGGADNAIPKGILGFLFNKLRKFELHRTDAVIKLIKKGTNLLDIGCGKGDLVLKAYGLKLFKKYYAVDISSEVIENARKNILNKIKKTGNIKLDIADVDNILPYKDSFFNTVTFVATLEHIFDPYHVINEINRVTKKGGSLIIEVPNFVWLPRRISVLFGLIPSTGDEGGWDSGHLHYFNFKNLSALLENCGYKVVYKGSSGIFSNFRDIYPEILSANIIIKAVKTKNAKKD